MTAKFMDIPTFLLPAKPVEKARDEAEAMASLPGEEWRPFLGHEWRYSVSNKGRVRSNAYTVERVFGRTKKAGVAHYRARVLTVAARQGVNGNLPTASVSVELKNGKNAILGVGRAMLQAFRPAPQPGMVAVPVDNDPRNLDLNNWAWLTVSERNQMLSVGMMTRRKTSTKAPLLLGKAGALLSVEQRVKLLPLAGKYRAAQRRMEAAQGRYKALLRKCKHEVLFAPDGIDAPKRVCFICLKEVTHGNQP